MIFFILLLLTSLHLFDFKNGINKYLSEQCSEKQEATDDSTLECEMHPDSWGAFSWITDKTAKTENEFPNRKGLCFYWCNGDSLDRSVIPQLYDNLYKSS